jgi:hypothetical protein
MAARADHFARHILADLFLDTLPYNAHTTACDGGPCCCEPSACYRLR